jgi:hypothetical protein
MGADWWPKNGHGIGPTAQLFLQICDRAHFLATNPWPKNGLGFRTAFFAKFSTFGPVSGVHLRPQPMRTLGQLEAIILCVGVLLRARGLCVIRGKVSGLRQCGDCLNLHTWT